MRIVKKFNEYLKENTEDIIENDIESPINNESPIIDATEEEGEYIGTKQLKALSKALGVEVVDNSINYEGKKINFYSETEKFHIDNKKFKTVDEVLDYLGVNKNSPTNVIEEEEEGEEYIGCPECGCDPCECKHCSKCDCTPCECDDCDSDCCKNCNCEPCECTNIDKEYQGFGLKDSRIKIPREEEAMESIITKKFKDFK